MAGLDRAGLGAHPHAGFGIAVIGTAKSRFRTATHAVPVLRGSSARPLFVTAGMPAAHAPYLVRRRAGRCRLPDALRRPNGHARVTVSVPAHVAGAVRGPRPCPAPLYTGVRAGYAPASMSWMRVGPAGAQPRSSRVAVLVATRSMAKKVPIHPK